MIAALSSTGKHLTDPIHPQCGGCVYFLFADTDAIAIEINHLEQR